MSRVEQRNGNEVWEAFKAAIHAGGGGEGFSVRLSEIMQHTRRTRPTVQKYMRTALAENFVKVRYVGGCAYWRMA